MSGIAGVVARGGAPADAALLERMAAPWSSWAPEGTASRVAGQAGLVHALMLTGDRVDDVPQPLTLDGRRWIVADARIDARDELVRGLGAAGIRAGADAPAAELILHAVAAWGDAAPAHLLGDFAFAIWDTDERRLFCARSPFGFKPFFYAPTPSAFVFASSLDAVRAHPAVGENVDETWIGDFLVHGDSRSLDRTVFADVRMLPAAHALVLQDGRERVSRFWSMPAEPAPLRLRSPEEYAERFFAVLRDAVRDRLPADRAGLLLSGGRDSTALAAAWRDVVDAGESGAELRAYTVHQARLMADEEPRFAGMAAARLGIPHELLAVDDYGAFARWDTLRRPQPIAAPLLAIEEDLHGAAARHARVLLTGQGADALLRETPSRLTRLVADGHPLRALREAAAYLRWHRRVPRPGLRTWARPPSDPAPVVPIWIEPEFAARSGLTERIAAQARAPEPVPPGAARPEVYRYLQGSLWPILGSSWHPGATGRSLELRHPYFDLRLVGLVLSIPPAQWYNDKGLLRIAMRSRLPGPVVRRGKTPVAADPLELRAKRDGTAWLGGLTAGPEVDGWVDRALLPAIAGGRADLRSDRLYADIRPLALSLWLSRMRNRPKAG